MKVRLLVNTRRTISLVLLVMALMLTLVIQGEVVAQEPPTLPIRFNAGSDQPYTDQNGRLYFPDQEWTPQTQAGHIGGYHVSAAFSIGGTSDEALYKKQRRDWQEYRFSNIPNGSYLVTLHFSQIAVVGDYGPVYTIFDVAIEDQIVLDDFNIFAQVGGDYALTRRFVVTVADGELNVVSTSVFGESCLAAIGVEAEVEAEAPDMIAPARPTNLTVTESYNAVLLGWADNSEDDLDCYYVYRAGSPDGTYTRLTAEPVYVSRYQDVVTATHLTYYYRIGAVDVYGNESDWTFYQSIAALDENDATLPYYQLELLPESLLTLYTDPWTDDEVPGKFTYEGQTFPVEVRYRGNWGRYFSKKSWKIRFPEDSPFPGQGEINLRSDFNDTSLMRSKLATDLFEAAGIRPRRVEHVLLTLNGEYLGVYTCAEQVDERFVERTGRDPGVNIYKVIGNRDMDFSRQLSSESAYQETFEKKSNRDMDYGDLIAFIEFINNAPGETFAYELGRVLDVVAYLDYHAIIVLTSNLDFSEHNVYLFHDLSTERWELIPYDFDNAFGPSGGGAVFARDWGIDMGTPGSPIWGWVTNTLLTRILDVPQFRAYYCHRLAEFMDTIFSDAAMYPLIDATYAAIEQDGLRDWHKSGWENHDGFIAAPDELKAYVTERKNFLWEEMLTYCSADQFYLNVNEVMVDNQATLEDPDEPGEFPPWFEIHNKGLETVDLAGMYLTDDLADPTRFQITDGVTIPAGGFITFFADGDPEQGPLHTVLDCRRRLDGAGGQIGIFSGTQQIDAIDAHGFGLQKAGMSEGRYPDGVDNWISFNVPTPGGPNLLLPPVIGGTTHVPLLPTAFDMVIVTATITDDGTLLTTTLYYSGTGSGFVEVPMTDLPDNLYAAQIPPQFDGSLLVEYYLFAGDNDGQTSTVPHDAPGNVYEYVVGYEVPNLFINEFMADNETVLGDPDESGEFPDWIELYNPGTVPIDLGGKYLTDDLTDPTKFQIPDGLTIPAGGFALFYADNEPEQGPFHTNFRLNRDGEYIGLFDSDAIGNQPIDTYAFAPQTTDVSERRYPNGGDHWIPFRTPTPGRADIVVSVYLPVVPK